MINALNRILGYFIYLRKAFGVWGALKFFFFYLFALAHKDKQGRLHYIPVGPYIFYFAITGHFAGLFHEIFFKEEYYLDYTDEPLQVFDCGANIGVALLYIKLRAPNAHVTCFEPNPHARALLQKNIDANGWQESVNVIARALGAQSREAEFYFSHDEQTDSSGSLIRWARKNQSLDSYTVSIEPLSKYLTSPIDFLKMDIEGSEFEVVQELADAKALQYVAYLQLEYHHAKGIFDRPVSDMLKALEAEGFATGVLSTTHPNLMAADKGWRNCMVYAWREK